MANMIVFSLLKLRIRHFLLINASPRNSNNSAHFAHQYHQKAILEVFEKEIMKLVLIKQKTRYLMTDEG